VCACVCACATQDDVDHLFAGQLEDHPRILKVNVNSSISFTGLFCIVFSAPSNSIEVSLYHTNGTWGSFVSYMWYTRVSQTKEKSPIFDTQELIFTCIYTTEARRCTE